MRGRDKSPHPPRSAAVAVFVAAIIFAGTFGVPAGASPTPLPEDQSIVINGGGWGHGHGMSQYGARAMAAAGKTWQQIVANYYRGSTIAQKGNTAIRVLVASGGSVVVGGDYPYTAKWSGGSTIGSSTTAFPYMRVRPLSSGVVVEHAASLGGPWTSIAAGTQTPRFFGSTGLIALHPSSWETRVYREVIEANRRGSTLIYAINQLSMDHYLYGVVGREMPSSWPADALKAQAVAARSYAMFKRAHTTTVYDICANTGCQSYGGYAYKSTGTSSYTTLEATSVHAAVDGTTGLAAVVNGAPIFAEFNSSSGGYTAPGGYSYLAPVPDPWDATYSPYYRWTTSTTVSAIEAHWPALGRFVGFGAISRDGYGAWGGRVNSMDLLGTSSNVTVSGSSFQSAFGLRSRLFIPAVYAAQVESLPDGVTLSPGQTATVPIRLKNTGTIGWPLGGGVQLGTAGPLDRKSSFQAANWPSSTRAANVTRNVSRASATVISPGDIAEFSLSLTASTASSGVFREQFRPVSGTAWFASPFTITIRVGSVSSPALNGNLVDDPSFEQPAGPWSEAVGSGDTSVTSAAIDGVRSLAIAGDSTLRKNFVQHIDRSGEAGDNYVLSAWNRAVGSDPSLPPASVTVKFRYMDGTYDWHQILFPAGDHAWTPGQILARAAKAYGRIDVYTEYFTQAGSAWFDGIYLAPTLLQDPDYGSGAWSIAGAGSGRDGTQSVYGIASLHLHGDATKVAYAVQHIARAGGAGDQLVLAGWNRATGTDPSRGRVYAVAAVRNTDGSTSYQNLDFGASPHAWRYNELPFTTTKPYSSIDVFMRLDHQTGDGWFDGVRLAMAPATITTNDGFEDGTAAPTGWALTGAGSRDTTSPLAGAASLKLTGDQTHSVFGTQTLASGGPAGARFVLSGWNRAAGTSATGGPLMIIAAVRNQDGTSSVTPLSFARAAHGWSLGQAVITTTKPYARIDVYARIDRQTGSAWFDNVRLSPTDGSLSDDPGFEAGVASPTKWIVTGTGARDTSTFLFGAASLRLTPNAQAVYATQHLPLAGAAGRSYLLSGWNRTLGTSAQKGPVYLVAALRNLDGTTSYVTVSFARGPHGWAYGEATFAATKAFQQVDLYARVDDQTGTVWFDDLRLVALG